jgi:hypothetical protein
MIVGRGPSVTRTEVCGARRLYLGNETPDCRFLVQQGASVEQCPLPTGQARTGLRSQIVPVALGKVIDACLASAGRLPIDHEWKT